MAGRGRRVLSSRWGPSIQPCLADRFPELPRLHPELDQFGLAGIKGDKNAEAAGLRIWLGHRLDQFTGRYADVGADRFRRWAADGAIIDHHLALLAVERPPFGAPDHRRKTGF